MTKTDLITAINTQLTAIITQAKVRLASLQLVNELFPIENNYTSVVIGEITYNLNFKKVGNTIFLNGKIKNQTGSIITGEIYEITNSVYFGKTGITYYGTSNDKVFEILNNKISINSAFGDGESIYINASYQTND